MMIDLESARAVPLVDVTADRRARRLIGASAVIAVALRLPFIAAGASMDEGGYAYVAQQWSRGARLYGADWIDRPQGLIVTYRFLLWIGSGQWTIRFAAAIAGAAITVLLGAIAWMLLGRSAGVIAAAVYSVVGIAPHLEGFTFNGELAASLPATAAVAATLAARRSTHPYRWLVCAGLLAGTGVTMKQSGIDGLVAGIAIILVTISGDRARRVAAFLAAAALPVGACVVQGALTGWHRYWQALIGYQLAAMDSGTSGTTERLHALRTSLPLVEADLRLLIVAAVIGIYLLRRSRDQLIIVSAWLLAAAIGINLGGAYWGHYYVQCIPPLVLASSAALVRLHIATVRRTAIAAVLASTLLWLAALIPDTQTQRENTIPYYGRVLRDERITAVIDGLTKPSDRIFIVYSEANIYWLTQRTSPYPYVWGAPIEKIPGAVPQLDDLLAGPGRPALLGVQGPLGTLDPSGRLARIIRTDYELVRSVDGMYLYRPRTPDCPRPTPHAVVRAA